MRSIHSQKQINLSTHSSSCAENHWNCTWSREWWRWPNKQLSTKTKFGITAILNPFRFFFLARSVRFLSVPLLAKRWWWWCAVSFLQFSAIFFSRHFWAIISLFPFSLSFSTIASQHCFTYYSAHSQATAIQTHIISHRKMKRNQ